MRGLGCGPAEENKIYKPIYINTLKNALWCYISPLREVAISQLIAMKYGTLIELTYVINFIKFGVDRSQGWSLVSSQILGFFLYSRSRA